MIGRIRLIIRYLRDKDVSIFKKLLIIGSMLYLISPVDIVPDYIIGLGILDDITVLSFIWLALKSELDDYNNRKGPGRIKKAKVIPFENRGKK
ncbi:MAG: YkvA family protein [Pseudomonadota bacterium]